MMDPFGAAAGGIVAICVVVVLPLSLAMHLLVRRRLLFVAITTVAVPVVFTLVIFALERALDDPGNEPLRRAGLDLVWWSFWPALIASSIAAAPVFAYAIYRRRWPRNPPL
jgi:cobalamin synthase